MEQAYGTILYLNDAIEQRHADLEDNDDPSEVDQLTQSIEENEGELAHYVERIQELTGTADPVADAMAWQQSAPGLQ